MPRHRLSDLYFAANAVGNSDIVEVVQCFIDRRNVHSHDFLAFLAIGVSDRVLDRGDSLVVWQDAGNRERACLHDGVDPPAESALTRNLLRIDGENTHTLLDDLPLR